MMLRLSILTIFLLAVADAESQSSKPAKKKKENTEAQPQPSSVEPYYPAREYKPQKRKPSGKITYNARDQFYERMEQVAKANRKAEKELLKPQYSNPTYFGHKKPPKRNFPGKLKYCKECGIRH